MTINLSLTFITNIFVFKEYNNTSLNEWEYYFIFMLITLKNILFLVSQ